MARTTGMILVICVLLAGSMVAWGATTKSVTFDTRDDGESKAISNWGIDATWVNFDNARKSAQNAGDQIDFIRIGFYLHEAYNDDGSLSSGQIYKLNHALAFVNRVDNKIPIMLTPHNEEGIVNWYKNPNGSAHVDRWFNVMEKTREYVESKGHPVVSLEVFNEPDWHEWNMGHKDDLDELLELCEDWKVLRVGPSTLSSRQAEPWYDSIEKNLDAGSTHTLGGTMEQYIDFIDTVKDDKNTFMNPEAHALVEVIVGAEEGIDSACWWGHINVGRAAFMKACQGKRIAYVSVEKNWSAACIYRGPDGTLYGFASTNERSNGIATDYKFICDNEDVTYYPEGNTRQGVFRTKGEPYLVRAKISGAGKESITKWFTIVPGPRATK